MDSPDMPIVNKNLIIEACCLLSVIIKNYNLFQFKYLLVTAYYNPKTGNGKQQETIWKSVMGLKEILRNSTLQMIGD